MNLAGCITCPKMKDCPLLKQVVALFKDWKIEFLCFPKKEYLAEILMGISRPRKSGTMSWD